MTNLETIADLSHEFGSADYVKGGGGNTSVKNETTLWVKPSGTTLAGLKTETFVAMNRLKINKLYDIATPACAAEREELVKNWMAAAVRTMPADRQSKPRCTTCSTPPMWCIRTPC